MIATEKMQFAQVLEPAADRFNGDPATAPINMKHCAHVLFLLDKGAGATGTATLTVESCDNAASDNPVAIPFRYRERAASGQWGPLTKATAAGFETTAGANRQVAIELDDAELEDGKPFVRVQVTEATDGPVAASILAVLCDLNYFGSEVVTGLA